MSRIINKTLHCLSLKTLYRAFSLLLILISNLASWQSAMAQEDEFPGEKVVHLLEEPRHRTVLQEGQLYLIDMQLNIGDESLPHTHDQAILLNYISEPEGPQHGRLRVITDYATEEFTHKINNPGPYLFHIIVMVHDGNGEPIDSDDAPIGMEQEPEIENNWFRAYRIELDPGESTSIQQHSNPTVIVLGTEGIAHVTREDGITRELALPGDWAYRDAGANYQITNVGDSPAVIVVNEVRRQHSR